MTSTRRSENCNGIERTSSLIRQHLFLLSQPALQLADLLRGSFHEVFIARLGRLGIYVLCVHGHSLHSVFRLFPGILSKLYSIASLTKRFVPDSEICNVTGFSNSEVIKHCKVFGDNHAVLYDIYLIGRCFHGITRTYRRHLRYHDIVYSIIIASCQHCKLHY